MHEWHKNVLFVSSKPGVGNFFLPGEPLLPFFLFFFISEEPQKDDYKKKFGYLTNSYFYSTVFLNTFSTSFKSYGTSNLNCKWQWEMTKVTTT